MTLDELKGRKIPKTLSGIETQLSQLVAFEFTPENTYFPI